jgi:hypothetical protein
MEEEGKKGKRVKKGDTDDKDKGRKNDIIYFFHNYRLYCILFFCNIGN